MHAADVDDPPAVAFSIRDRILLAEYRMLQRDRAPILLALDPACPTAAAQALERLGARVPARRDAIASLRACVPPDHLAHVPPLAGPAAVPVEALPELGSESCRERVGQYV